MTTVCENCGGLVPSDNISLHAIHCQRNTVTCPDCKKVLPKWTLEKHFLEEHSLDNCRYCKASFPVKECRAHEWECDLQEAICVYCSLPVLSKDFSEHQDFCGSRTELCEKCSKYVLLRDQWRHDCSTEQIHEEEEVVQEEEEQNPLRNTPETNSRERERERESATNRRTQFWGVGITVAAVALIVASLLRQRKNGAEQ